MANFWSHRSMLILLLVSVHSVSCQAARAAVAVEHQITIDGLERTYLVFVPSKMDRPLPVVLAFHGGGGNARQMERFSRFDELAEREGFVVIYPEAIDGNWNDGRGVEFMRAQRENINDVKFVRLLLDDLGKTIEIDRRRIFATGISNGGFISHRLAAEASDLICGIAPVVGGMAPTVFEKFDPPQPVSILLIQSDADPLVPIGGGDVGVEGGRKRGKVVATTETLATYVKRNGNTGEPMITTLDNDPKDGTTVEIAKYRDGLGGVKTTYYLVKNGGHNWPGRGRIGREQTTGKACQEFNATQVIWDFFKSCPSR